MSEQEAATETNTEEVRSSEASQNPITSHEPWISTTVDLSAKPLHPVLKPEEYVGEKL